MSSWICFKNISFNLLYTQDVQTVSWGKKINLCMKEKTHFNKIKQTKKNTQNWVSHLNFFLECQWIKNNWQWQNLKQVVSFISLLNFQSNYGRWLDQIKNKNVNKIIQKGLLSPLPIPHAMSLILLVSWFLALLVVFIALCITVFALFLTC